MRASSSVAGLGEGKGVDEGECIMYSVRAVRNAAVEGWKGRFNRVAPWTGIVSGVCVDPERQRRQLHNVV
jgi:hypothetical protein